ncbi:Wzz/FepE/Etk N-terminal domain-containing protein [Prosthecochloris sp.]|uniref:Wzz/FepE/Etk N-terminal domain-containing protein n=1 Tax=Prosthecochloris sp. TaxID=290513 RepID=UPI00257F99F7|nr:Wzz/FepE/Etk N-terminal domain-containing protein [Prosthecochloris sp.]
MLKEPSPKASKEKPDCCSSSQMNISAESIEDEISLIELWDMLWGQKKLIIVITLVTTVTVTVYSLISPPLYQVESLVRLQDGYGSEAIVTLQSITFLEDFIRQENLLPWIFWRKWDSKNEVWIVKDNEIPSLREGGL